MFKITQFRQQNDFFLFAVRDKRGHYLHSDGRIFHKAGEYFPTREDAQKVLDKYQPKYEWKHGDVFKCRLENIESIMIYMAAQFAEPQAFYLWNPVFDDLEANLSPCRYLENAEFLFNIKDKL